MLGASQVVKSEGTYAEGKVVVEVLPHEVYGHNNEKAYPIRRLQGKATSEELAAHAEKELLKVSNTRGGTQP